MKRAATSLLLLLLLAALGASQQVDLLNKYLTFASYKSTFNKRYSTPMEEKYRETVYLNNLYQYEMINTNESNTYQAGVTPLSDLTPQEFKAIYLNLKYALVRGNTYPIVNSPTVMRNASIDWVRDNKSTPPKDEGACGTSWAYSAVALVESLFTSQTFPRPDFSEQQLIDCVIPSESPCEGGSLYDSLEYIRSQGIAPEGLYPSVVPTQEQPCREEIKGKFKIFQSILEYGCQMLVTSLRRSPAIVTVDASNWAPYVGGVLNECGQHPNYAAVAVGVTADYWKVKCAWGVEWGEAGYIRLAPGNTCGVCNNIIDTFL